MEERERYRERMKVRKRENESETKREGGREGVVERVIRNELALEQTLKDIKETNTKVVDALRKLQDENDKVNTSIESMESMC